MMRAMRTPSARAPSLDDPQPRVLFARREAARTSRSKQISDALAVDDVGFVWVGLYEPDEPLLLKMQEEFGLHPLAVEDALKAHQRPKIELYGDSLFLVLQTAQVVKGHIEFGETHVFIGAALPADRAPWRVAALHAGRASAANTNPTLMKLGPSYGLYAVLDCGGRQLLPDRRGVQGRAQRAREGHLRRGLPPRDHPSPVRTQARPDPDAPGRLAHAGHAQPADAVPPDPDPRRSAPVPARRATTTRCA